MPQPPASASRSDVPKMGCGYAVCAALALAGLALLYIAQDKWSRGNANEAWIAGVFGAVLCLGGTALIAPMQREVARARERRSRETDNPVEPWTWNPAWTEPAGIPQTGRRHGRALVIFGVMATTLSFPALMALPREVARGNHGIWLALIFPLVGGGFLAVAAHDASRRRKYGTARFVPATVPMPLGGELAGMIVVDRPVIPLRAGRVALDCWRTRIEHAANRRTQREDAIAHTEREVAPGDWITTVRESRLFVQLPLRGGAETTMSRLEAGSPTHEWRLRVHMPTAGADFAAEFVVPVFGGVSAVSSAGVAPPGAATRASRNEIWRTAGVREEPEHAAVSTGTALVFPVGQGRAVIATPLIMAIGFAVVAALVWVSPIPNVIAAFLALIAALPALTLRGLWSGGGERVWIETDDICIQRGGGTVRRIPRRDVQRIERNKNVGVGVVQFFRIVASTRPARAGRLPPRVGIASMVRGDEAAAEAVAWLNEQLAGTRS